MATKPKVDSDLDSAEPKNAKLRSKWEAELREEYGEQWLIGNAEFLELQWRYLVESNFLMTPIMLALDAEVPKGYRVLVETAT